MVLKEAMISDYIWMLHLVQNIHFLLIVFIIITVKTGMFYDLYRIVLAALHARLPLRPSLENPRLLSTTNYLLKLILLLQRLFTPG